MNLLKAPPTLTLVCLSVFYGCTTTSIATNRSDQMKGPYKRVFMIIHSNIRVDPFSIPWAEAVQKELDQRGVASKVYSVADKDNNSLSLEPQDNLQNEINSQINEFQPDAVMIIILKKIEAYGGVQIGRPGSNGATFDIKLFAPTDANTPLWRAKFQVFGQYGISTAVNKGTRTFVGQLEKEYIIEPLK
jgi:hypothetical protein